MRFRWCQLYLFLLPMGPILLQGILAQPTIFPLIGNIRLTKIRPPVVQTTTIAPSSDYNYNTTGPNEFPITVTAVYNINSLSTSMKSISKSTGIFAPYPSGIPTMKTTSFSPTDIPISKTPSIIATTLPSAIPTSTPSMMRLILSTSPSISQTTSPIGSRFPTVAPTTALSKKPTPMPVITTSFPSNIPTNIPSTKIPSIAVSATSSRMPSAVNDFNQISSTSNQPTGITSITPITTSPISSGIPTAVPTAVISKKPTPKPTAIFTSSPSGTPTVKTLSNNPIAISSATPSILTTTAIPSTSPTNTPSTKAPSSSPSLMPSATKDFSLVTSTVQPSRQPSPTPTIRQTTSPFDSRFPTAAPTSKPSKKPISRRPSKSTSASPTTLTPTYTITASPTKAADVAYHNNGSVLTKTVNIYHVYFGRFDTAASQSMVGLMNYFASNIYTLPWFPVLTEYYQYQNRKKVSGAHNATFKGSAVYKPGGVALTISVIDIVASIATSINSGKLPVDQNGVYFVIFRGDFIHNGWLTQWCGYHGSFVLTSNVVIKFAVVGDPSTTNDYLKRGIVNPACAAVYPPTANGNFGADSMITTYAHELVESITDWDGSTWYAYVLDSQTWIMEEIGDLCNWNFGQNYSSGDLYNTQIGEKSVLVQQVFKRNVGCVLTA